MDSTRPKIGAGPLRIVLACAPLILYALALLNYCLARFDLEADRPRRDNPRRRRVRRS